jgi:drug/metabolite transporter superfamily protein YnfA
MNSKEKIQNLYLTGAFTAAIVILLTILDIIIGSATGGDLTNIPLTAVDKFSQIQENKLLGLYNLDLLNLTVSLIFIPTFIALYLALRNDNEPFSLLSLIIFVIGTTVFITNNAALSMLDLSQKFQTTETIEQKNVFAAAGEALLSKGAHGSIGVFPGFVLITLSELLISLAMLKGVMFSKATAYFGIFGTTLLFIYLILVTFVPSSKEFAILLAAPGGILSLIWMILFTFRLFKLSNK